MDRTNKRLSHSSTKHMAIDKKTKLMKAIEIANFMRDRQGKLMRTNDWSTLSAAVRTMIDGGQVKLDFLSNDYLTKDKDDTDSN